MDWHSKETASGRIMNFNATQPKSQIINTAKNFIERVLRISDEEFHTKNTRKIYTILTENSFPVKLISNLIEEINRRFKNNNRVSNTENINDKRFYSVQYIPGLTDNRNIRTAIKQNNISFAYKANKTLNTIFTNVKTPIDQQQQNNIVYEISCRGSKEQQCNQIYIGTTKRALATRMGEHRMDIAKGKDSTALSQHVLSTGHTADLEQVRIIDKERIERKRFTKESLHIQKQINRTMNLKEDTSNINASYMVAIK